MKEEREKAHLLDQATENKKEKSSKTSHTITVHVFGSQSSKHELE